MNLYPPKFGNNPLFPKSQDFEVITKDINVGKGIYCYKNFYKGQVIAMIAGEIVQNIHQHSLQIDKNTHLYDIYFSGYFLHSCNPNISLNMQDRTVTALKNIEANSYLFMDYSETEDVLFKQFSCSCGSPNCRKWIVGKLEEINHTNNYVSSVSDQDHY